MHDATRALLLLVAALLLGRAHADESLCTGAPEVPLRELGARLAKTSPRLVARGVVVWSEPRQHCPAGALCEAPLPPQIVLAERLDAPKAQRVHLRPDNYHDELKPGQRVRVMADLGPGSRGGALPHATCVEVLDAVAAPPSTGACDGAPPTTLRAAAQGRGAARVDAFVITRSEHFVCPPNADCEPEDRPSIVLGDRADAPHAERVRMALAHHHTEVSPGDRVRVIVNRDDVRAADGAPYATCIERLAKP